tara:strand:+ start:16608 stop:17846 length:1239 start_codon:yes stop_codon:yes gene_type:complete
MTKNVIKKHISGLVVTYICESEYLRDGLRIPDAVTTTLACLESYDEHLKPLNMLMEMSMAFLNEKFVNVIEKDQQFALEALVPITTTNRVKRARHRLRQKQVVKKTKHLHQLYDATLGNWNEYLGRSPADYRRHFRNKKVAEVQRLFDRRMDVVAIILPFEFFKKVFYTLGLRMVWAGIQSYLNALITLRKESVSMGSIVMDFLEDVLQSCKRAVEEDKMVGGNLHKFPSERWVLGCESIPHWCVGQGSVLVVNLRSLLEVDYDVCLTFILVPFPDQYYLWTLQDKTDNISWWTMMAHKYTQLCGGTPFRFLLELHNALIGRRVRKHQATKIQRAWRKYALKKVHAAATTIQTIWRLHRAKRWRAAIQIQHAWTNYWLVTTLKRNRAAIQIQRQWRIFTPDWVYFLLKQAVF